MDKSKALDFLIDRAVETAIQQLVKDGLIVLDNEEETWTLTEKGWKEYKKYQGKPIGKPN